MKPSAPRLRDLGNSVLVVEHDEEAELGDAPDARVEVGADLFFQITREIAVVRLALGGDGATFEIGNLFGDLGERLRLLLGLAVGPKTERLHERAVNGEVRVTPDRRGEMRVAAEIEPEMPDILRVVDRLALRAQDDFGDHFLLAAIPGDFQKLVEIAGPHRAFGERIVERIEIIAHGVELFRVRLVMDAVDQGNLCAFERFGRRYIGEDHEFLDHPVRVETVALDDFLDVAVLVEDYLAFGQVEIERRALVALFQPRMKCGVEVFDDGLDLFRRRFALADRLRLFIGELGVRAHHGAHEAVPLFDSAGGDDHLDGEAGPVHIRLQRAEIVRQPFGQHRHDAVGQISRVAALQRFNIERAVGAHEKTDVGDGDDDAKAARIFRVGVGFGEHRVVMVFRVGGVDGDERRRAQVGPLAKGRELRLFGFRDDGGRKLHRNAVIGERD